MLLKRSDGRNVERQEFIYYAGEKYGWLKHWPEMLDDLRDGFKETQT